MEALVRQALELGFDEAHARRVLAVLADTDEAVRLLSEDASRLANALLDAAPRGASGAGGSSRDAGGAAECIDLTADSDEERAEAPPRQPPAAPSAATKRPREEDAADGGQPAPAQRGSDTPAPAGGAAASSLLAQLAAERHARRGRPPPAEASPPALPVIKLLTYNVWFAEDVALETRMRGIGAVVSAEEPHVVCFQEVTPRIEALLRAAPFFASYDASPAPGGAPYYTLLLLRRPHALREPPTGRKPFSNSRMGRDVLVGALSLGGGVTLLACTSHLESYCGPGQTSSSERVAQMDEALRGLESTGAPNTLFAGDTNWDDAEDGDLGRLLPAGWGDAWQALRPGEPGYTYDAAANAMLMGSLKKRLDRVLFKLRDYEPAEVRMVGTQPIAGATYEKQFRNGGSKRMPVCNSDHFGLLFTARLRAPAGGRVAA